MKYLTLNTHNFTLGDRREDLSRFCALLRAERPDGVALQEVCRGGGTELPDFREAGYSMLWIPVKLGYGIYDEGVALLVPGSAPPVRWGSILLTPHLPYVNWRRRMALWAEVDGVRLVCLHMSWQGEGFEEEWERLWDGLGSSENTVLMGDFNTPLPELAERLRARDLKDASKGASWHTVEPSADGWRGRGADSYRIDGIALPSRWQVKDSRPVAGGISDHRGVMVECAPNNDG